MTKDKALHSFFSSFGLTAYLSTDTLTDREFPYLTYTPIFDNWGNPVVLTVNLWYKTDSETIPNAKAQEIADSLPKYVPCDGGAILVTRGSPFVQSLTDASDSTVKRRYMNIIVEFLTIN